VPGRDELFALDSEPPVDDGQAVVYHTVTILHGKERRVTFPGT